MTSLLGGGEKVPKDSVQVEAYGALDDLVSFLGFVKTKCNDKKICAVLEKNQDHLFRVAAHVSVSDIWKASAEGGGLPFLGPEHIEFLEDVIEQYEKDLPELQNFVLPGGTELAALFHIARTEARRVERRLVALNREIKLHPQAIPYLNRLSDVFFILARCATHKAHLRENKWIGLGRKGV